ncbi:MAG: PspA/IM30 family protein [Myxococcales bacterium]|nr:PspA/IM30 family protein [Myxococcales bacterium]
MGIVSRLSTVLRANLNALADKGEDPAKRIEQTIRDMQAELKRARRDLITTMGTAKRLEQKRAALDEDAERWEARAVVALREGDETLAREALRQKRRVKTEAEQAQRQSSAQLDAAEQMKTALERIEERVKDLETRKASLAAQVRQARSTTSTDLGGEGHGSAAFAELDRLAGQIDQLDAEAEAHAVLDDPARRDVEARLRALGRAQRDEALEEELQALKREVHR